MKNHELDVLSNGYDQLSQDAQDAMDDILKALKNNSDLQQEQVDTLLSSIVGKYEDAYSKIGKIIESTGVNKDILLAEGGSKDNSGNVKNDSTNSSFDSKDSVSSAVSSATGNSHSSPTLDSKTQDSMIEETKKAYDSASPTISDSKNTILSDVESAAEKAAEEARKRQEVEAQQKTQKENAEKETKKQEESQKEKEINALKEKLYDANTAFNDAWEKVNKHTADWKKSNTWKEISDKKKSNIKKHKTIETKNLKKGHGLDKAKKHNELVEKEKDAKKTAYGYVDKLKSYGVPASVFPWLKGYAKGGQVDGVVPVETLSDLLPDVKNKIRSNKDDGLISAKIGVTLKSIKRLKLRI